MEELKVTKSINKKYFTLNENIEVTLIMKNMSSHTLKNIYYFEETSEYYELISDSIFVDNCNISLRDGTNIIIIGEIPSDSEKVIRFKLKTLNISDNGKLTLKGRTVYYFYGDEKFTNISIDTLVCGVNLKLEEFYREKDVVFAAENCTYRFNIINKGNMVASNVTIKYDSSGRLRTRLGSIYINNINISEAFIEEGFNIGTIFENETKVIEFKVYGKKEFIDTIKADIILISYSAMNPQASKPTSEVITKEVTPLILIKDDLRIEKLSEDEIINKESFAKIKTKIINNTGVAIRHFRLSENFSTLVNLSDITLNNGETPKIEGNYIIIDEIKNNSEVIVTYNVFVRDTEDDFLEVYSEGIYNIGALELQKRFKKESKKIYIELNINRLDVRTQVKKNNITLDEGFERKIIITNVGNKNINRVRLYDILNIGARIVKGSFSIDNEIINSIDTLNEGIDIGVLPVGENREVKYHGEFLEYFIEKNLEIKCYCTYNVRCRMTEEVSESYTEAKVDILQIDRTSHEFTIEKRLDIEKMYIKDIISLRGTGAIKYSNIVNVLKEIKSEGRFVPCRNLLTQGYLDITLEYISSNNITDNNSLCSLNVPIEFSEVVESTISKENIKNYILNVKAVNGTIKGDSLIVTCLLEIIIN